MPYPMNVHAVALAHCIQRGELAWDQRALTGTLLDEAHVLAAFDGCPRDQVWSASSDDWSPITDWLLTALGVVGPF